MPDLLLELLSEEIPARMQGQAAADLQRLVTAALVDRGLTYEGAQSFATPRRLALHVVGLPARQPDTREERKGPRVGAPEGAIQGFLKSAGLMSINEATIVEDKKGASYVARIERPGRPTPEVLSDVLPGLLTSFPWPKSMRWGRGSDRPDALRWVRPLHSIVCTFGADTEEPDIVPFAVGGIAAGETTRGHRFMAPAPFRVKRFDDYVPALERARVVLDPERRRSIILHDARDLAFAQGFELVEDEALLAEVAGLVEWPVVLMGQFEEGFLAIPPEVIRATIRVNQKCFVLRRPDGTLANRFLLTANIVASDGGRAIVAGNERVVRARLSDAKFFWESDLKVALADRLPKLDSIVFHEKLGTQGERVTRVVALARDLAPLVGADPEKAARAATLAKADLVSEMVGEFPELQGLMGRYYAAAQGEDPAVAAAVEEHYKPQGPSDRVPTDPVSVAVALADKLDTLVGFWAIDEKPTGSKDPYALRRAALGIVRTIVERAIGLKLRQVLVDSGSRVFVAIERAETSSQEEKLPGFVAIFERVESLGRKLGSQRPSFREKEKPEFWLETATELASDLLAFFADRLKVYLRDKGARHDLIDAVFALPGQDDLLLVVRRVEALGRLLDTEDGRNLLAGARRATNILRAEEKKDGAGAFAAAFDPALLELPAERALAVTLGEARTAAAAAVAAEDFEGAMRAIATLRPAVDAFFEQVTVNATDPALRANRLRLLNGLRETTLTVADLSKVAG